MAMAAFLSAGMSYYVFDYGWSWNVAMLFGCVISATDPIAVVAILNNLGTSLFYPLYFLCLEISEDKLKVYNV